LQLPPAGLVFLFFLLSATSLVTPTRGAVDFQIQGRFLELFFSMAADLFLAPAVSFLTLFLPTPYAGGVFAPEADFFFFFLFAFPTTLFLFFNSLFPPLQSFLIAQRLDLKALLFPRDRFLPGRASFLSRITPNFPESVLGAPPR